MIAEVEERARLAEERVTEAERRGREAERRMHTAEERSAEAEKRAAIEAERRRSAGITLTPYKNETNISLVKYLNQYSKRQHT